MILLISDTRIRRRLVFKADYPVQCSDLHNQITRDLLKEMAKTNSKLFKEICSAGRLNFEIPLTIRVRISELCFVGIEVKFTRDTNLVIYSCTMSRQSLLESWNFLM